MRPLVHIGYHKTATTWFQRHFYPRVANARFVPRETVRAALIAPGGFAFDPARARDLLGLAAPTPAILCEEGLSGYLHHGGFAGLLPREMAARLHATLPEAEIVVFVRAQPAMIAATYQQYVKGGGTYGVSRYLGAAAFLAGASAEPARIPRFSFELFDYHALVRHYRALFGAARVHVFAYEDFRRDPAGFVAAYAARFGFALGAEPVSLAPVYRSYNRPALYLSRLLGHFTYRTVADKHWLIHLPLLYPAMRALCEGVSRLPPTPPGPRDLLGDAWIEWIARRYAASNRILAADTGLPLAALGYPLGPDDAAPGPPPIRTVLPRWTRI